MGPDSVEAVSHPSPLNSDDVDDVDEEQYAEMLRASPVISQPQQQATDNSETAAEELLRSMDVTNTPSVRKMDANYESMSLKELQALAKTRGLSGAPTKKRELVDFLKKAGAVPESSPQPLGPQPGDLADMVADTEGGAGFTVELESNQ